jgi:hypothetical protein
MATMDAALVDSMSRRVARLHVRVARTVETAQETMDRARAVSTETAEARRKRWTLRYERAFARHVEKLGDLTMED